MGAVHKIIDLVGTSTESVDDAIRGAIAEASRTLHGLEWFEVKEMRGGIGEGKVTQFQVVLRVGFKLDRS
ncbi:MAG TPA: dodecin [Acetobacteraceae bacterium]|nr:dodecin [Acetobacteraceae bacterium]